MNHEVASELFIEFYLLQFRLWNIKKTSCNECKAKSKDDKFTEKLKILTKSVLWEILT